MLPIKCPKCEHEFPYPAPAHRTFAWVAIAGAVMGGVVWIVRMLLDYRVLR